MVWSLALRPDDAKEDPVVYGTKFGVVFLAEGPRTDYNFLILPSFPVLQQTTSSGIVYRLIQK